MGFPRIRHCLVCEDIRVEKGNKATILGFYGITPDVHIKIRELGKPIQRLMFVFLGAEGGGQYKVTIRVVDPDGGQLRQFPSLDFNLASPASVNTVAIGIHDIVFVKQGEYKLQLIADDNAQFETKFLVSQGQESDFR
jgi:hypothetical protein